MNPRENKLRLIVTLNAQTNWQMPSRKSESLRNGRCRADFAAPLDPGSVHQGAALEVKPLTGARWKMLHRGRSPPRDSAGSGDRPAQCGRDPALGRSVGRLRCGGTRHHAAPETGALAKTAVGALERQPYLRVRNLADAITRCRAWGIWCWGWMARPTRPLKRRLRSQGPPCGAGAGRRRAGSARERPVKPATRWSESTRQVNLARSMSPMPPHSPYMQAGTADRRAPSHIRQRLPHAVIAVRAQPLCSLEKTGTNWPVQAVARLCTTSKFCRNQNEATANWCARQNCVRNRRPNRKRKNPNEENRGGARSLKMRLILLRIYLTDSEDVRKSLSKNLRIRSQVCETVFYRTQIILSGFHELQDRNSCRNHCPSFRT